MGTRFSLYNITILVLKFKEVYLLYIDVSLSKSGKQCIP